jgi:DNA-binding winged helix-turn-helix (wHTH) protein
MSIDPDMAELERGFRLGRWRVQPRGGVLRRPWPAGRWRRVEPKVMQVLLELAKRPRQFVSKDELFSAIWGLRPSSDDRLTRAVHALRHALEDDPQQPRYIETRTNVGYRLIAPVRPARRLRQAPVAIALACLVLAVVAFLARPGPTGDVAVPSTAQLSDPARAQFLQARYWLATGDAASLESARNAFVELIAIEPDFAPAWEGQAQAGLELFKQGRADVEQLRRARVAAERAIALAGSSPARALCLGQIRLFLDWDFAGAEALYREAIRMDPREPKARIRYSWLLVARGDFDAAAAEIEQVRLLDPLYYASEDMAALLLYAGQLEAALAEFERLARTTSLPPPVLRIMGTAYWSSGDPETARKTFIDMWAGLRPLSQAERDRLEALDSEQLVRRILDADLLHNPVAKAGFHALLGEQEEALATLELAISRHVPHVLYMGAMPEFAQLRSEPAFRRLLARLGLEHYPARVAAGPHNSPSSFVNPQDPIHKQQGDAESD